MGVTNLVIDYERRTLKTIGLKYLGLIWCELGNQRDLKEKIPAKKIYTLLGVKHVSFDLNGEDKAIKIDLSKPISPKISNSFDVITDYGTIEHINDQFQTFKNLHNLCKVGGIMIHTLPLEGNWKDHGRYNYSPDFFKSLAKIANYEIVNMEILDKNEFKYPLNMLAVTLKKTKDNKFITPMEFGKLKLFDSGHLKMTEDYTNNKTKKFLRITKSLIYSILWRINSTKRKRIKKQREI